MKLSTYVLLISATCTIRISQAQVDPSTEQIAPSAEEPPAPAGEDEKTEQPAAPAEPTSTLGDEATDTPAPLGEDEALLSEGDALEESSPTLEDSAKPSGESTPETEGDMPPNTECRCEMRDEKCMVAEGLSLEKGSGKIIFKNVERDAVGLVKGNAVGFDKRVQGGRPLGPLGRD